MVITLVPCATQGWVPVSWCGELSFLLSSLVVNVSDPSVGDVLVVPHVLDYFVRHNQDPFTPQQLDLVMTLDWTKEKYGKCLI